MQPKVSETQAPTQMIGLYEYPMCMSALSANETETG